MMDGVVYADLSCVLHNSSSGNVMYGALRPSGCSCHNSWSQASRQAKGCSGGPNLVSGNQVAKSRPIWLVLFVGSTQTVGWQEGAEAEVGAKGRR